MTTNIFPQIKFVKEKSNYSGDQRRLWVRLSSSSVGDIQGSDERETDPKFFRFIEWSEECGLQNQHSMIASLSEHKNLTNISQDW